MKNSVLDVILKILVIPEIVLAGYLLVFWLLPFLVNLSVSLVFDPAL